MNVVYCVSSNIITYVENLNIVGVNIYLQNTRNFEELLIAVLINFL